ncbi:MAG TPA: alpha/beta hydrolase [Kofleriaceae bacterium]|nr:alpha/beta hydrolase [Kofleriaceae bacterium]
MPIAELPNLCMSYQEAGSGEPIVLLHGLGSCAHDWEEQIEAFASSYRVIAPDLRGHGDTDKLTRSTIAAMAEDVVQLLAELGIQSVHVVGMSMGGMIAFQLALDAPQLVKSLVIVNSGPDAVPRTLRHRFAIFTRFALLRVVGLPRLTRVIANKLFPASGQEMLRRRFVERASTNDPTAYKAALDAIVSWSVADRLSSVVAPTLVISADQDYTPVSFKADYVAKLPNARLVVIPDSRHATPMDQPARFNATVLEFLAGREHRINAVAG